MALRDSLRRLLTWVRRGLIVAGLLVLIDCLIFAVCWGLVRLGQQDDAWLSRWANVAQILQGALAAIAVAPIVWAVFRYRRTTRDQRKAKHYQAWQAISDAQGKAGSGGRKAALEDLYHDKVDLMGVDLSGADSRDDSWRGANLEGLKLPGAFLMYANFVGAIMSNADLRGADLGCANLRSAKLHKAKLQEAELLFADLQYADLANAELQNTRLGHVDLKGANLRGADLQNARLGWSNLQGVDLGDANLQGADLGDADLGGAELSTARNLTREQILSARDRRGTKLPPDLKDLEEPFSGAS